jgi:fatty acid synthase
VTCGTVAKRAFLLEAFPQLDDAHIGDSRSCSFEALIKRQTNGAGVHLALNSLADDKLQVCAKGYRGYGTGGCQSLIYISISPYVWFGFTPLIGQSL